MPPYQPPFLYKSSVGGREWSGKRTFWNMYDFDIHSSVIWKLMIHVSQKHLNKTSEWLKEYGWLSPEIPKYGHLKEKWLYFH